MRPLLHIGFHKTGTTSIQAFLRDHGEELANAGWRYPNGWLQLNCHFELPLALMRLNRLSPSRQKGDDWQDKRWRWEAIRQVRDDLRLHMHERTILSCEEFSLFRFDDELRALRSIVGDAEIVVFTRNKRDWLESLRAEQEKIGFGGSIDPQAYNYLADDSWRADHQALIAGWKRHFSKVRVFDFDRELAIEGSVVTTFCRLLGISAENADRYWLNRRGTKNEGRTPGTRWGGRRFGEELVATTGWLDELVRRREFARPFSPFDEGAKISASPSSEASGS